MPADTWPARGSGADKSRLLNVAESFGNMGHWHTDLGANDSTWSEALCVIYGLDPASFTPTWERVTGFCHPDDRSYVEEAINDALSNGKEFEIDHRIVRPDGEVRTIICKGQPEIDGSGRLLAMFGVVTDVTEAFDAIRSIQDQKEMLGLAAQLAHLGHWVWSAGESKMSYCSEELARIHDTTPEEFAA
ncbi:MAG: PAS domain-containing protein, partial [Rhodospirillaceae bacterium]